MKGLYKLYYNYCINQKKNMVTEDNEELGREIDDMVRNAKEI
jgi:hypothetical protein